MRSGSAFAFAWNGWRCSTNALERSRSFHAAKSPASFEQWFSGVQFDGMTDGDREPARSRRVRAGVGRPALPADPGRLPAQPDRLERQESRGVSAVTCASRRRRADALAPDAEWPPRSPGDGQRGRRVSRNRHARAFRRAARPIEVRTAEWRGTPRPPRVARRRRAPPRRRSKASTRSTPSRAPGGRSLGAYVGRQRVAEDLRGQGRGGTLEQVGIRGLDHADREQQRRRLPAARATASSTPLTMPLRPPEHHVGDDRRLGPPRA